MSKCDRSRHSGTNVPAEPFLFHLRCSLADVSCQVVHIASPALEESLDVLKIELKKLGKLLSIIIFGVKGTGEQKLHDSSGR